ncbi:hypothetical protein ACW23B_01075 [Streptomyces albidoflavus]
MRRAEPLQNLALIVIFPLMFASSAYVPVADLPSWLGAVASVNPRRTRSTRPGHWRWTCPAWTTRSRRW